MAQTRRVPAEILQRTCACGCGTWVSVEVISPEGKERLGTAQGRRYANHTCVVRAWRRKQRAAQR